MPSQDRVRRDSGRDLPQDLPTQSMSTDRQPTSIVIGELEPLTTQLATKEIAGSAKRSLADWLRACGVTHVAMEATGVYWKPVWNILDGQFAEVLLVNAQHIKAVPGRKTDQKDSEGGRRLAAARIAARQFCTAATDA